MDLKEKYNILLESFIPTNLNIIKYLSKNVEYLNYEELINDIQCMNLDMYN